MCTQDDLDLVRADEDGMIDRREDEGHPVNTDPPRSPDARLGALYEALQDHELLSPMDARWADAGTGVKDAFRTAFLTAFPANEADSGVEEDATYTPSYVLTVEISERTDADLLAQDISTALDVHLGGVVRNIKIEHVPGGYLTIDRSYERRTS